MKRLRRLVGSEWRSDEVNWDDWPEPDKRGMDADGESAEADESSETQREKRAC